MSLGVLSPARGPRSHHCRRYAAGSSFGAGAGEVGRVTICQLSVCSFSPAHL